MENFKKVLDQAFRNYTNILFNPIAKEKTVGIYFGRISGMVQAVFALNLITIGQHFQLMEVRKHIQEIHKAFMESRDRDYPMAIRRQVEKCRKYAHEEIQKILETETQTIN